MKVPLRRVVEAPIEEVEMNLDLLAQAMTEADREDWLVHLYEAMNDRGYFSLLGKSREYHNPSEETITRLKLFTMYEVL